MDLALRLPPPILTTPLALALALGVLPAHRRAAACPYSIRDAAFMGPRAAYELEILVRPRTPGREALAGLLEREAPQHLAGTNVTAHVTDLDAPASRDLAALLESHAALPARLPAAVLVSPEREVLALGPLEADPSPEALRRVLARAADSPARREIRTHLTRAWCTVVLVDGGEGPTGAPDQALEAFAAAASRITGTTTELGRTVTRAPALVRVRRDDSAERVLLWSLRAPGGDGTPFAVVLAGRGVRRGPALRGNDITARRLHEIFEMLGRSCSCTASPLWLSGTPIPLAWTPEDEAAARAELGFDPNDPGALADLGGFLRRADGTSRRLPAAFDDPGLGYTETILEPFEGLEQPGAGMVLGPAGPAPETAREGAASGGGPAAGGRPLGGGDPPPASGAGPPAAVTPASGHWVHQVLVVLLGLALVFLAGTTWFVLRRRPG